MDDFINKVGWGLNLVFSNGVGYPRTHWLVRDGSKSEQQFKYTLRRHQLPTQVWYKAYPGLTAFDIARNTRIREGVRAQVDDRRRNPHLAAGSLRAPMQFSNQRFSEADFQDIQGLVRFGHGHLTGARFYLLNIADAAAARAWLAAAPVTNAATTRLPDVALQVAFTYDGLKALGLSEEILRGFSDEFIVGMAGDESRSRRLGDVGPNDPSRWQWGRAGAVPHMMVLLYATPERLASREAEIKRYPWPTAFAELGILTTDDNGANEPFGFKDGISQPAIDWERNKPRRLRDTIDYTNVAALGEFLLGYPNEYTRYTDRPLVEEKDDPSAPSSTG